MCPSNIQAAVVAVVKGAVMTLVPRSLKLWGVVDQVMALPELESQPEIGKFHGNSVVVVGFETSAVETGVQLLTVTVTGTVQNVGCGADTRIERV